MTQNNSKASTAKKQPRKPKPPAPNPLEVTPDHLLAKIGLLTMENELLRGRVAQLEAEKESQS